MEKTCPWKFSSFLHKKISLRTHLILSHVALLCLISIAILYSNHRILNPVLINLTLHEVADSTRYIKAELAQSSTLILTKMDDLVSAIAHDLLISDTSPRFFNFLFELVKKNPIIQGVHWESSQGTFLSVDRLNSQTYLMTRYEPHKKPYAYTSMTINTNGQPIQTRYLANPPFDPRHLSWFRSATKNKIVWTESNSFQNPKHYGITASKAVYNAKNQLIGALAFKVGIQSLKNLNEHLEISPSGTILIYDNQYKLLAAAGSSGIDFTPYLGHQLPFEVLKKIGLLNVITHPAEHRGAFEKRLNFTKKESYYLVSDSLPNGSPDSWNILFAVPAHDILGPLYKIIFNSLIWTFIVLSLILVGIIYFAKRISNIMNQIVHESEAIQQLQLDTSPDIHTKIKELHVLAHAFEMMKSALLSFECYVPKALIKKLFETGEIARVGGEVKTLTILFTDLYQFTSLIEHQNPQQVMKFLHTYLDSMSHIINDQQGTIDKYIGDAIMAFWGAPIDDAYQADHACHCVIRMLTTLRQLNQTWKEQGLPELQMRVGLNTGIAIVGNVGSSDRLNYTALGDSVNLASRLEQANKIYNTNIIISEHTYHHLHDAFPLRFLDNVLVRGRQGAIKIYELAPPHFTSQELKTYNQLFSQAFAQYAQADWPAAIISFHQLATLYPQDQIAPLYEQRCEDLQAHPPVDWKGYWRLT